MNEILFGGKIPGGEWVEGDLIHRHKCVYIRDLKTGTQYQVDPESVRRYTILHDRSGKKIWEGSILEAHYDDKFPENATVSQVFMGKFGWRIKERGHEGSTDLDDFVLEHNDVIGHIFDNPELMEG